MRGVRSIRGRVAVGAVGAVLLVGAAAPPACQPATKALSTLHGWAPHSSVPEALDEPPCPAVQEEPGLVHHGSRSKWGFRIAAADPQQWLSLRPCLTFASSVVRSIGDSDFTIYTDSGDVTGTAAGTAESMGFDIDVVHVELEVTGGTRAYREARGSIHLVGCLRGGRFVSAQLRGDVPPDLTYRCDRFIPG